MRRSWRRLLGLVAPQRAWIALGAFLAFLAVAANVALMAVSAYLVSKAALVTNVADIALAITTVRVLAIGRAAFRYFERTVTHRATFAILADLRVWFYRSIEPLAPARLEAHRAGDLLSRIVADIDSLEDFYVRVLVPPLVGAGILAFSSILLGLLDGSLALALLAFLLVGAVALPVIVRGASRRAADQVAAARAELTALVVDEIQGLGDLLAFGRANEHRALVLATGRSVDRIERRLALLRSLDAALTASLAGVAGIAVLVVGIGLVSAGRLDPVYLAILPLVAIASFEVAPPLAQSLQAADTTAAAADRLFDLIDAPPVVVEPSAPSPEPPRRDLSLEVRGLRFRYGSDRPLVLDGLDLSMPAGTSLAIVGPSGAGKSTLVNLLLRFWEYAEGEILLDGRDLRDLAIEDVRRCLGVVEQDVHLFNATIRDNLSLADADLDDARMIEACRLACIDEAIAALPAGYDTRIGEDGVLLSGGERQRIAIARAIIRDAPILILDEATANLDPATEATVLTSIAPFMAARTTLVITHRGPVAARCERAVALEDGRATTLR